MKKNVMMRVAALLMVCVLATTCGISGTFAKYTSKATGTATAKVAKWDVTVGGVTLGTATKDFTFSLFDTIVDTEASNVGNADTDVATGHIAPGTKGSFTITITNSSEVNVSYDVALTVPVELEGIITFTVSPRDGNLNMTDNKTVDVVVSWVWPFVGDDTSDTALGVVGAEDLVVTATVTVTQVD